MPALRGRAGPSRVRATSIPVRRTSSARSSRSSMVGIGAAATSVACSRSSPSMELADIGRGPNVYVCAAPATGAGDAARDCRSRSTGVTTPAQFVGWFRAECSPTTSRQAPSSYGLHHADRDGHGDRSTRDEDPGTSTSRRTVLARDSERMHVGTSGPLSSERRTATVVRSAVRAEHRRSVLVRRCPDLPM
jgi:hypothetical protein